MINVHLSLREQNIGCLRLMVVDDVSIACSVCMMYSYSYSLFFPLFLSACRIPLLTTHKIFCLVIKYVSCAFFTLALHIKYFALSFITFAGIWWIGILLRFTGDPLCWLLPFWCLMLVMLFTFHLKGEIRSFYHLFSKGNSLLCFI